MLLRDLKAIFIHIPKTGGQSIERFILRNYGLEWSDRGRFEMRVNHDMGKGPPHLAHLTATEYLRLGYCSQDEFRTFFKFSFVRNPFDRLVSAHRFFRYHGLDERVTFKDLVFRWFPDHTADNHDTAQDAYRHVIPQARFLSNEFGQTMVNFVGRFERLEEDFGKVRKHLGLGLGPLAHENKSLTPPEVRNAASPSRGNPLIKYHEYYDAETEAFVARLYAQDFELFGYRPQVWND